MKAEDVINEIANRPELLQKIVERIYEKLREDLIIKRLDKLEELIRDNNERINKLEEIIKTSIDRLNKLEEAVKDLIEANKRHSDEIKKLYEQQLDTKNSIEDLKKSIDKLDKRIATFTSRSGHKVEKAMMELYKEALELHGVDPNKVQHGEIVDEKGVAGRKGWKYEVDFYEVTDNEIYIFEVKTRGDRDAIKQLLDRKSVFESQGKKVTKMFLVCHVISEKDKELAEEYGVTVIAGEVKGKSK